MKKLVPTTLSLLCCYCLISCAPHEPTNLEITANQDVEKSVANCQDAQAKIAASEVDIINAIPADKREMIALLYLNNKNTVSVVAAATGHSMDPCRQSNLFDAQIAEVKEKTKQIKEGTGIVRTAVPWVVGGLTVNALADKAGQGLVQNFSATDNGKINLDSQNSGSNNAVGHDYQNNGVNNNTNSDCKDCDKSEDSAGIEKIKCSIDADCAEGQVCSDGFCVDGASTDPPKFDLKACQDDPPFGLNQYGTPLWTNGCSCLSHSQQKC
jgi:hypothetical protein